MYTKSCILTPSTPQVGDLTILCSIKGTISIKKKKIQNSLVSAFPFIQLWIISHSIVFVCSRYVLLKWTETIEKHQFHPRHCPNVYGAQEWAMQHKVHRIQRPLINANHDTHECDLSNRAPSSRILTGCHPRLSLVRDGYTQSVKEEQGPPTTPIHCYI